MVLGLRGRLKDDRAESSKKRVSRVHSHVVPGNSLQTAIALRHDLRFMHAAELTEYHYEPATLTVSEAPSATFQQPGAQFVAAYPWRSAVMIRSVEQPAVYELACADRTPRLHLSGESVRMKHRRQGHEQGGPVEEGKLRTIA